MDCNLSIQIYFLVLIQKQCLLCRSWQVLDKTLVSKSSTLTTIKAGLCATLFQWRLEGLELDWKARRGKKLSQKLL